MQINEFKKKSVNIRNIVVYSLRTINLKLNIFLKWKKLILLIFSLYIINNIYITVDKNYIYQTY